MASRVENINTRLDQIAAELAGMTWGPDVSDQGRSIQLVAYRKSLLDEQRQLIEDLQKLSGPFEVHA